MPPAAVRRQLVALQAGRDRLAGELRPGDQLVVLADPGARAIRLTATDEQATLSPTGAVPANPAAPEQESQSVNDRWRTVAIILAVVLALLGGIAAAEVLNGGPAASVPPSPTTAAGASAQPSPSSSAGPSSGPSLPLESAAPSAPASATPAPSPTPQANLTSIDVHRDAPQRPERAR